MSSAEGGRGALPAPRGRRRCEATTDEGDRARRDGWQFQAAALDAATQEKLSPPKLSPPKPSRFARPPLIRRPSGTPPSPARGECSSRGNRHPPLHDPQAASRATPARPIRGRRRRSAARGYPEQVPEAGVGAPLQRFDQHPPVGKAADAHPPDEAVVRRIADVVVEF